MVEQKMANSCTFHYGIEKKKKSYILYCLILKLQ